MHRQPYPRSLTRRPFSPSGTQSLFAITTCLSYTLFRPTRPYLPHPIPNHTPPIQTSPTPLYAPLNPYPTQSAQLSRSSSHLTPTTYSPNIRPPQEGIVPSSPCMGGGVVGLGALPVCYHGARNALTFARSRLWLDIIPIPTGKQNCEHYKPCHTVSYSVLHVIQ